MPQEFKQFIQDNKGNKTIDSIINFFVDNNWFNEKIEISKDTGKIILSDVQVDRFKKELYFFVHGNINSLYKRFENTFPDTYNLFNKFCAEMKCDEQRKYYIIDFMLYRLKKEIPEYDNSEMDDLVINAAFDMIKEHGDFFTFFISWIKYNNKVKYTKDYTMAQRYSMEQQSEPYSFDEYIQLSYYLFNDEYIKKNNMFAKAAKSKNCTDAWLYLAIHFIRPLRQPDLERIHHPELPYEANKVIENILNGSFSDNDARNVILSITNLMAWLPLKPTKTDSANGVTEILFDIPRSCEVLIGKLFALAEAHRIIAGKPNEPIIRKVSKYQEINSFMGEDIGKLFISRDFCARSATKSFLQEICMIADEEFAPADGGFRVNGYYIAALARNHKGGYKSFADTTFTYLKNSKLGRLSAEQVAFEMSERGVFSFVASSLLKIVEGDIFEKMTPQNQTELIKAMDLSPKEIEIFVYKFDKGQSIARDVIKEAINNKTSILTILHRIGTGEAKSKMWQCDCLLSAIKVKCPFDGIRCIGCDCEISYRATFYHLLKEYNRLSCFLIKAEDRNEIAKYKKLMNLVVPMLDEMLAEVKKTDLEAYIKYENLILEYSTCQLQQPKIS